MSYAKTLIFRTQDLGVDATLLLVFDKLEQGLYNDKFPVVWKVSRFAPYGPFHTTVTFSSQLAWTKPQVDHGSDTIVDVGTFVPIDYNQQTTLQESGSGVYQFSTPETGTPDYVTVSNGTPLRQDVALGFLPQGAFSPVVVNYWPSLSAAGSIQTGFQPVLRAYITSQYQETQIVRGEISTPVIFEQNLSTLDNITTWNLGFNPATGQFSITQA